MFGLMMVRCWKDKEVLSLLPTQQKMVSLYYMQHAYLDSVVKTSIMGRVWLTSFRRDFNFGRHVINWKRPKDWS